MRAALGAPNPLRGLLEKPRLDPQSCEAAEIAGRLRAYLIRRVVGNCLADVNGEILIDRHPHPHAVQGLAGRDWAAVRDRELVRLRVRELCLDVEQPVSPFIAMKLNCAAMDGSTVDGWAQRHSALLYPRYGANAKAENPQLRQCSLPAAASRSPPRHSRHRR